MNKQEMMIEFANQLAVVKDKMWELSEIWEINFEGDDEILTEKYPFDISFDEMAADIDTWYYNILENIEK